MRTLDHVWTVEEIKEELPCVSVLFQGRHYIGRVSGRLCRFATVWVKPTDDQDIYAEYSWEAVTRAKNGNHSLSLG